MRAAGAERQVVEVRRLGAPARSDRDHDDEERCDRERDEHPRERGGARDAAEVDGRQCEHREQSDGALQVERAVHGIRREGQRHRGARAGLPDHEPPAGHESPPLAEPLAAVDVRAAGGGVLRGELGGRGRVAERDARGEREAEQQPAARRLGGRGERGEHARPDHRAEPDHDGVARAEAAGERAHIRSATRCAAAVSSSSETFGSTSSQSGSIIPAASTIPSGRGSSQTWKCAPPSPQR